MQVLLAADVLCELEDRRELSLSGLVTAFQRECRRYLASKWLQRRRVLETAIRCIQVGKFIDFLFALPLDKIALAEENSGSISGM